MSRSGTYPTIGKTFKVEKYGAEAVRDVGGKGAGPRSAQVEGFTKHDPIISQDSTPIQKGPRYMWFHMVSPEKAMVSEGFSILGWEDSTRRCGGHL